MRIVILILVSFLQIILHAQVWSPEIFIETDFMAGAGKFPPFYLISNRQGIFSEEKNAFLLRTGIVSYIDTSKRISLSYGLDAVCRYDSKSVIWLQQGFARIKLHFLLFQGGLFEESIGNQDDQLSSGGYLFSGNARPIPKIAIYTNGYITVPYTNNLLEIKGYISHGWFGENGQYVKNAYLHHKYLYIRIGEKKFPLIVNMGIQHAAMWGGVSPVHGNLPSGWDTYKSVLLAKMKGDIGPVNEQKNVLGNHLGSYSLGIDYKSNKYSVNFYWQTILEDKNGRVGVDWKNKGDGLWGITVVPLSDVAGIKKMVFEFFNSTSQSGDPKYSGNDNYFNNFLYRSGWTYREMTIGTPLITSPIFSDRSPDTVDYLDNNRVRALMTGIIFAINGKYLSLKLTYSRNYGTVDLPYYIARDQLYSFIGLTYNSKRYRDLLFSWEGAIDIGSHLGNNVGLMLRVRKTF